MPKSVGSNSRGKVDLITLMGVGFLVTSLVVAVGVTTNPVKTLVFNTYARYSAEAKINKAERAAARGEGPQCSGAGCLLNQLLANQAGQGTAGAAKPSAQQIANQKLIDTYNTATSTTADPATKQKALDKLKTLNETSYNKAIAKNTATAVAKTASEQKGCEVEGGTYKYGNCYQNGQVPPAMPKASLDKNDYKQVAESNADNSQIAAVYVACNKDGATDCNTTAGLEQYSLNKLYTLDASGNKADFNEAQNKFNQNHQALQNTLPRPAAETPAEAAPAAPAVPVKPVAKGGPGGETPTKAALTDQVPFAQSTSPVPANPIKDLMNFLAGTTNTNVPLATLLNTTPEKNMLGLPSTVGQNALVQEDLQRRLTGAGITFAGGTAILGTGLALPALSTTFTAAGAAGVPVTTYLGAQGSALLSTTLASLPAGVQTAVSIGVPLLTAASITPWQMISCDISGTCTTEQRTTAENNALMQLAGAQQISDALYYENLAASSKVAVPAAESAASDTTMLLAAQEKPPNLLQNFLDGQYNKTLTNTADVLANNPLDNLANTTTDLVDALTGPQFVSSADNLAAQDLVDQLAKGPTTTLPVTEDVAAPVENVAQTAGNTQPSILTRAQTGIQDWWTTNIQDDVGFLPPVRRFLNPTTPVNPVAIPENLTTTTNVPNIPDVVTSAPNEPFLAVAPQPQKTWIDNLPTTDIRSSYYSPSPAHDPAQSLIRYADNWDGAFDPTTSTLNLKPQLKPNIVQSGDNFIDSTLAKVENRVVTPIENNGYHALTTNNIPSVFDEIPASELPRTSGPDALIFRGVNYEGMENMINEQTVGSGINLHSIGESEKVFFTPHPTGAFDYAAKGDSYVGMANFDKPSYVVAVKWPAGAIENDAGEVIIGSLPLGDVVKIYEIRPYEIKPGNIPLDHIITAEGDYLMTPNVYTMSVTSPKGQFVYREVPLGEVEDMFGITPTKAIAPAVEVPNTAQAAVQTATEAKTSFLDFEWNGLRNSEGGLQFPIGRATNPVSVSQVAENPAALEIGQNPLFKDQNASRGLQVTTDVNGIQSLHYQDGSSKLYIINENTGSLSPTNNIILNDLKPGELITYGDLNTSGGYPQTLTTITDSQGRLHLSSTLLPDQYKTIPLFNPETAVKGTNITDVYNKTLEYFAQNPGVDRSPTNVVKTLIQNGYPDGQISENVVFDIINLKEVKPSFLGFTWKGFTNTTGAPQIPVGRVATTEISYDWANITGNFPAVSYGAKPTLFQNLVSNLPVIGGVVTGAGGLGLGGVTVISVANNWDRITQAASNAVNTANQAYQNIAASLRLSILPSSQQPSGTIGTVKNPDDHPSLTNQGNLNNQLNLPGSKLETAYPNLNGSGIDLRLNLNSTPDQDKAIAFIDQIFNDYNKLHPLTPGQELSLAEKQAFIDYIKQKLSGSEYSYILGSEVTKNGKTYNFDYFMSDYVAKWYGFTQQNIDKSQVTQCAVWQILVAAVYPQLDLANIEGYSIDQARQVFGFADNEKLNAGKIPILTKMARDPNGEYMYYMAGDIVIWHYNDINKVQRGDTYVYGNHMGVILNKFTKDGKLYFEITEANSPKGNLDGTPITYIVDEEGFKEIIGLQQTVFLRPSNRANSVINALSLPNNLQNSVDLGGLTPQGNKTPEKATQIVQNPAQNIIPGAEYATNPAGQKFLYWNQLDFAGEKIPGDWKKGYDTWKNQGCGIMVGAMVTGLSPYDYYNKFKEAGNNFVPNKDGIPVTGFDQMTDTLNSMGYTVTHISKEDVLKNTNVGTPVVADSSNIWVEGAWRAHFVEVIGIDANGNYIVNDPVDGSGRILTPKQIDKDGDTLNLYAISPPNP